MFRRAVFIMPHYITIRIFQSVISLKNHENEKSFILFYSLYHYNGYYIVYVLSRWETSSVSQYWLGMCYLHGIGTDTNLKEYDYWINESSKNGYKFKE